MKHDAHQKAALRRVGTAALAAWLCATAAQAAGQTAVHELPTTQVVQQGRFVSREGRDYALRQLVVRPGGAGHRLPATLIDLLTGTGDWARPDAARLPALATTIPAVVQARLHWFYGGVVGWMPVPAGWRLQEAVIGVDGNTGYTFVAPAGAASGWLSYGVTPACLACVLGDAEGLLPGAHRQEVAHGYAHGVGPLPLRPVPDVLAHPDVCTALLRYRSGALVVRAAELSSLPLAAPEGDLSEAGVYLALPAAQGALAEAIIGDFRHRFVACHAPDGWPAF